MVVSPDGRLQRYSTGLLQSSFTSHYKLGRIARASCQFLKSFKPAGAHIKFALDHDGFVSRLHERLSQQQ
jgi:hypothetical protein